MLNLSSKDVHQTQDGLRWEIYQSEDDANVFYVAPRPQLARRANGDFQFALVEYAGENAGGYCTLTTELGVPEVDMAEIKTYLTQVHENLQLKCCSNKVSKPS